MARTATRRTAQKRPTTTNLAKGRGMSGPGRPPQPAPRRQTLSRAAGAERRATPAWPWMIGLVLCIAGLAVASYLTVAHYATGVSLACPDTGLINCAKVTSSSFSKILGIPVAVLGLAFFAFMLPLQTPWAWRSTNQWLRLVRMGSSVVGIGFVLWLLYAELIKIGNICLYCTFVHALTFALFVLTAVGTIATAAVADVEADDAPATIPARD